SVARSSLRCSRSMTWSYCGGALEMGRGWKSLLRVTELNMDRDLVKVQLLLAPIIMIAQG
ncbi:hypothetical protein HAX54_005019, partial [Datura stramonium]|nr:hypothetical protein [Datura stramonium]